MIAETNRFEDINYFIYETAVNQNPTRYECIRYSTWRIALYQQLEAFRAEDMERLVKRNIPDLFPKLVSTPEQKNYYFNLLQYENANQNSDSVSHFICRMLYCLEVKNHQKFVEMERAILQAKLKKRALRADTDQRKRDHMNLLKAIASSLTLRAYDDFHVPTQIWKGFQSHINKKHGKIDQYARVSLEMGQLGIKKRWCFVRNAEVYMDIDTMTEAILAVYSTFLKRKLQKMVEPVQKLLHQDVEDQMNSFLRRTLESMNRVTFDDTAIDKEFKITLKNVESLWKEYYPPCMMNLTQKLKQLSHLKHEGRRQLWLFLKACGMDVQDNQEYFRIHFQNRLKDSEIKSHMYNIEHAYGLKGKREDGRPKICRNIITGAAPKRDEHHGCPFAHWRKEDLREYLRRNYRIQDKLLDEVIDETDKKHFQVACGRLFEGVNLQKNPNQSMNALPLEIANMLGKSPHEYFTAGLELVKLKKGGSKTVGKKDRLAEETNSKNRTDNSANLSF